MPEDLKEILDHRLLSIGGATVSVGSLFVGGGIVFFAIVLANLLAFSTRRFLRAPGAEQGAQVAFPKIVRYSVITVGFLAGCNTVGLRLHPPPAPSAAVAGGL